VASIAALSASSLHLIPWWAGIQCTVTYTSSLLSSSRSLTILLMICCPSICVLSITYIVAWLSKKVITSLSTWTYCPGTTVILPWDGVRQLLPRLSCWSLKYEARVLQQHLIVNSPLICTGVWWMFAESKRTYNLFKRWSSHLLDLSELSDTSWIYLGPITYDHRVWKTGLPVRSAVLKPPIERGKFLKSLLSLKVQPYNFSVGAGNVGEDFITPYHPSRRWLISGEERWW
jgi:hypothetical protein